MEHLGTAAKLAGHGLHQLLGSGGAVAALEHGESRQVQLFGVSVLGCTLEKLQRSFFRLLCILVLQVEVRKPDIELLSFCPA